MVKAALTGFAISNIAIFKLPMRMALLLSDLIVNKFK